LLPYNNLSPRTGVESLRAGQFPALSSRDAVIKRGRNTGLTTRRFNPSLDLSSGIRPLNTSLIRSVCLAEPSSRLPCPSSRFPPACNGFAGIVAMLERVLISTRRARVRRRRACDSAFFLSPPVPGTASPSACARRIAGLLASARCSGDGAVGWAPYPVQSRI